MATITLRISKDPEEYKEFLTKCQIDHLYNKGQQTAFNSEKVYTRAFIKQGDALRSHNGCISCVMTTFGRYDMDYYYIIISNNRIDISTFIGMYEKAIPFMVNKEDIDNYNCKKILIDNELWEHLGE